MLVPTTGLHVKKYLWARVCASWGIHYIHTTRREAFTEDGKDAKLGTWCGPHKVLKLVPEQKG